ncbi:MAG: NlpC/P60 family protein [Bacteroidota bacterium]
MKRAISYIISFPILFLLLGCSDLSRENQHFADLITRVKTRYAPDRRLAIFDITTKRTNKGVALVGEVDDAEAKQEVIDAIAPLVKKITDSVTVLPDAKLAGLTRGIVRVSVANMRGDPAEIAELVSQATMGSVVKVLREDSGWYYIQTADKYLGWMKDDSFVLCRKEEADAWIAAKKLIVSSTYETVRQDASTKSYPVCDLVAGSLIRNISNTGAWTNIQLPDGRTGFVRNSSVTDYDTWEKNTQPTANGVEKTARSLIGIPYLWGGTTTKAMDCSGFTKTVYLLNGLQLNRDAYQQAKQGVAVPPGEKFENLHTGDLLFFGRKGSIDKPEEILHVALYLKDRSFIHSSGMVKINSLDPASSVFDPSKLKSFICARRILNEPVTPSDVALPR